MEVTSRLSTSAMTATFHVAPLCARMYMHLTINPLDYAGASNPGQAIMNLIDTSSQTPVEKQAKKRVRGRRRKTGKKGEMTAITAVNSVSGYVSESSSEHSKQLIAQKKTKALNVSADEQAKYLALDCEMVGVGVDGLRSTLARVTIVNWDGDIVYDQFIRPNETVTDYRTYVSGITAAHLEDDNVIDFLTCQVQVMDILRDKVLIGHALKNDLSVLKIKPFMKQRFDDGVLWPRKLKDLVYEHVDGVIIQQPGKPHSAYEDAYAAMQLYQTVRDKWEKVMTYKIRKTAEIEQRKLFTQPNVIQIDYNMNESTDSFSSYDS
jgi:RNA exonuclease 4